MTDAGEPTQTENGSAAAVAPGSGDERDQRLTWRTGVAVLVVALVVLSGMSYLALTSEEEMAARPKPAAPSLITLEFGVWGNDAEITAFRAVVADYNASSKDTLVKVRSWPTAAAMLADVRAKKADPDLYLLPRADLAEAIRTKRTTPLLNLVQAREIPIGDDFSRDAVSAFSDDDDLQCMPYTTAPQVIFYNKRLVDFDAMAAEKLPVPLPDHSAWSFAQFRAAAEYASRPEARARGIYVAPTLEGLAPFIYSGGGSVYDDEVDPTSLALAEDGAPDALRQTLELLRDPRLTLTSRQLRQRSALEWFKAGRLGMIAGDRSLVPELRGVGSLDFDVMPMPTIGSPKTVAELTGICLDRAGPRRTDAAANVLTYLVTDDAMARLAATGYVQPTKLTVAFSPSFLQPSQAPEHASVFTEAVRRIVVPPLREDDAPLQRLVGPDIAALLTAPVLDDLPALLAAIDEKSRQVLDPDYEPSESPSPSGTPSGTASPSGESPTP
ncbi:extracellular solute-binding protein [Nocardioides sp.]|uniref:extracellular solute-binding protein n=1 Tax=Nocardioides sp. TaxID=35761 RepID=UPI003516A6CF